MVGIHEYDSRQVAFCRLTFGVKMKISDSKPDAGIESTEYLLLTENVVDYCPTGPRP